LRNAAPVRCWSTAKKIRACITPIGSLDGKEVTTVDGLPARWAKQKGLTPDADRLHPVQQAWVDEQVPQCGICQFGMMIKVTELLEHNPKPTDADIKAALTTSGPSPHLAAVHPMRRSSGRGAIAPPN
jgi:isoquinoline 1-oxidoreductase alpha subunit